MKSATSNRDNNATIVIVAGGLPELDPPELELLKCSAPPAWIDLMLEEFAITLQVAPSSLMVALSTENPPLSSLVQVVPP